MPWKLSLFGEDYDGATLTLDDYVELEERAKVPWNQINPITSARVAKIVASVMYAKRNGIPYDEAAAKVGSLAADEYVDTVNFYSVDTAEDEPDPQKAGEL